MCTLLQMTSMENYRSSASLHIVAHVSRGANEQCHLNLLIKYKEKTGTFKIAIEEPKTQTPKKNPKTKTRERAQIHLHRDPKPKPPLV